MNNKDIYPLNIKNLPKNIKNLPLDIRIEIFRYLNDELIKYWKTYYSEKVLFELNPKDYFKKYILSKINKGYKLLPNTKKIPCATCFYSEGYNTINPQCDLCNLDTYCCNCYWYDSPCLNCILIINEINENENINDIEYVYVSWDDIKNYIYIENKYNTYYDLINSSEWLNTH